MCCGLGKRIEGVRELVRGMAERIREGKFSVEKCGYRTCTKSHSGSGKKRTSGTGGEC